MSAAGFNPSSSPSFNPSGYSPSNFSIPSFNPSLSPSPPLPTSFRDPIPSSYTASLAGRMAPIPSPNVPNLPTPFFQPSFTPPSSFSQAAAAPRPSIPPTPVVNPPSSFFNAHVPHARTAPSVTPSFPSSWAAPLSQPPSLPLSLQLPPPTTFNPALSLPSTPNLANPYLIISRPAGFTIPQPLHPASLRFPGSNPLISLPPPSFAAASLMPPSLSGPAQWISSFPSFQATVPPRRLNSWEPPAIERTPFPSNNALVKLPRSYSFSLQPQANFTFKADAKVQQAYRRQFEQNLKMFYQLDAPPERPFSQWPTMHVTQLAFQIDRHTTVFVNPATLTDFFQKASPAQKWGLQAQLVQLTTREIVNSEERYTSVGRVKTLALNTWHSPVVQGTLQVWEGTSKMTGIIAEPIEQSVATAFRTLAKTVIVYIPPLNCAADVIRLSENHSRVLTIGSIDHPRAGIGFINGINNSLQESMNTAMRISQHAKNSKVHLVYNATHGPVLDVMQCGLGHLRIKTGSEKLLKKTWNDFIATHHPDDKFLQICHSGGAIPVVNALMTSPKEIQQRIIVAAFAPATIVPEMFCFRSFNFVSKRDFVPYLDIRGYKKYNSELICLEPHPNAPFFDHLSDSPTFNEISEKLILNYLENIGSKQ